MKRKIVMIDAAKCTGCGLCIAACHEGALQLVNGTARLISESYCDGLGACLPECPTGAITVAERDAAAFNEAAVLKQPEPENKQPLPETLACGCPGTRAKVIENQTHSARASATPVAMESRLRQWPCQIKLVPSNAPYFDNAHLLVAADCTAYAYANLHHDFMANKITIIGCPKLDQVDYTEKLTDILEMHDIKSVTVLRMEVPCCGGIVNAVKNALTASGKMIPWQVTVIGTNGDIIE